MSHDSEALNFWVEGSERPAKNWPHTSTITQCGSGCIAIPKSTWIKLCQFQRNKGLPDPWFPGEDIPDSEVSEDIRMTRRAVSAGIRLIPMDGIRTYHWPTWNRELVYPDPRPASHLN